MSIQPLPFTTLECPVPWPTNASLNITISYPFLTVASDASPGDYVIQIYLETLWLPENIAPLHHLIPALRRVVAPSSSDVNPLPSLVTPLLLNVKHINTKYRTELPQTIEAGEGDGEIEEAMMWFAWQHEKREHTKGAVPEDEIKWTKAWLQRVERRETLIQTLLHMLVLTFPDTATSASSKRKRKSDKRNVKDQSDSPPYSETLDMLTDRLSIWQATSEDYASSRLDDSKDWLQMFCDEVVRPSFEHTHSALYHSLRSKCFIAPPGSHSVSRTPSVSPPPSSAVSLQPGNPISGPSHRRRSSSSASTSIEHPLRSQSRSFSRAPSASLDTFSSNSHSMRRSTSRSISRAPSVSASSSKALAVHTMRRSASIQRSDSTSSSKKLGSAVPAANKAQHQSIKNHIVLEGDHGETSPFADVHEVSAAILGESVRIGAKGGLKSEQLALMVPEAGKAGQKSTKLSAISRSQTAPVPHARQGPNPTLLASASTKALVPDTPAKSGRNPRSVSSILHPPHPSFIPETPFRSHTTSHITSSPQPHDNFVLDSPTATSTSPIDIDELDSFSSQPGKRTHVSIDVDDIDDSLEHDLVDFFRASPDPFASHSSILEGAPRKKSSQSQAQIQSNNNKQGGRSGGKVFVAETPKKGGR